MSIRRKPLTTLAASVAASLALGLATAGTAAATPLDWQPCDYAPGFQCTDLDVPLDYDAPSGDQISIRLIRQPATDPANRLGSLFWNAGGPGGAPTDTLPIPGFMDFFTPQTRARFDIVSFDPRGIGRSAQLRCFRTQAEEEAFRAQKPPGGFPVGAAQERRLIELYSDFARSCADNGGPIQHHMSTANVARDMDRIRAAIGESKLNYYGPSYGTYLGVTYANLFPSHAGRIVLDGNVDPVAWNDRAAGAVMSTFGRLNSPLGTELALREILRRCGAVDTTRCAFSAGTPSATESKYQTLVARVKADPITIGTDTFTYGDVVDLVAAYQQFQNANLFAPGWKGLAEVLEGLWEASDPTSGPSARTPRAPRAAHAPRIPRTPFLNGPSALLSGDFDIELDEGVYGVLCSESPNPTDPFSYQGQADLLNTLQSPAGGFGSPWAWLAAPCAEWQARDADAYAGPWDLSPEPYLLIGTVADGNTAYTATHAMADAVGNGRVLTESGGGHTALLNKSDCVDGYVDAFLASGTLPPRGTVCDQNRAPF